MATNLIALGPVRTEKKPRGWYSLRGALLTLLMLSASFVRAQDEEFVKPTFRHCTPSIAVAVRATAEPDIGEIQPTVMVRAATTVKLHGIAQRLQVSEGCGVVTRTLKFTWTLQSIPTGKLQIDRTSALANDTTLNPTFVAKDAGTYVATLKSIEPALQQSAQVRIEALPPGRTWFSIGPSGETGNDQRAYTSTGRLNGLKFDRTNPAVLYASSGLGGLWKSNDRGGSWFPLTEHKGLPTLGTGPVEVAADGAIYLGTGDLHPRTNTNQKGAGIWKSVDGGESWHPAGTVVTGCGPGNVAFTGDATRIASDPTDSSVIYVASKQGLFRSTNGGQCWNRLMTEVVFDLQLDPQTPTTIYAAAKSSGLLKITNASTSLTIATIFRFNAPALWAQVAIARSSPGTIYLAFAPVETSATLVKSTDAGQSWPLQTTLPCTGCNSTMALAVDPVDPNHIIYAEVKPHHSVDGGTTFVDLANDRSAHDDFSELIFATDDSRWAYAATDGGVYRLFMMGGGQHPPFRNWEPRNASLSITQVAGLAAAPTNPSAASLGAWDNGTQTRLRGRVWQQFQDGDGVNTAFDANSESTIYYNTNAGNSGDTRRLPDGVIMEDLGGYAANPLRGGELFGFGLKSKSDGKLYVLENSDNTSAPVWQCADPAPGSKATPRSIEFHPDGSYFAGYTDGSIRRFRLASPLPEVPTCAENQTTATAVESVYTQPNDGSPAFVIDPFNQRSLYALILEPEFRRVLRLTKVGQEWQTVAIDANLPATAKLSGPIAADPSFRGLVYLGDANGLWEGLPDQSGTYRWSLNLTVPDTIVTTIVAHRSSNGFSGKIRLGTYGRGVWERIFVEPPCPTKFCMKLPGTREFCLTCNVALDPTTTTSQLIDRTMWLSINYQYNGPPTQGLVMRVAPISNRLARDFFISSSPMVTPGNHTALLQISYAGARAPLSLHSEAIRVQIYDSYRHAIISSQDVPLQHLWVRPEGRILTISARGGEPGGAPLPATVLAVVDSKTRREFVTPVQIALPINAKVTLAASATNKQNKEEFAVWEIDDSSNTKGRTISLQLTKDISVTAVYQRKSSVTGRP